MNEAVTSLCWPWKFCKEAADTPWRSLMLAQLDWGQSSHILNQPLSAEEQI